MENQMMPGDQSQTADVQPKKRVWPWVLGGCLVVVFLIAGSIGMGLYVGWKSLKKVNQEAAVTRDKQAVRKPKEVAENVEPAKKEKPDIFATTNEVASPLAGSVASEIHKIIQPMLAEIFGGVKLSETSKGQLRYVIPRNFMEDDCNALIAALQSKGINESNHNASKKSVYSGGPVLNLCRIDAYNLKNLNPSDSGKEVGLILYNDSLHDTTQTVVAQISGY